MDHEGATSNRVGCTRAITRRLSHGWARIAHGSRSACIIRVQSVPIRGQAILLSFLILPSTSSTPIVGHTLGRARDRGEPEGPGNIPKHLISSVSVGIIRWSAL